jgi:hypothetical protein
MLLITDSRIIYICNLVRSIVWIYCRASSRNGGRRGRVVMRANKVRNFGSPVVVRWSSNF